MMDDLHYDITQHVHQAIAQVNAALETHARGLLQQAYDAGHDRGYDQHAAEYWGASSEEPTFEEFLAELIATVNS